MTETQEIRNATTNHRLSAIGLGCMNMSAGYVPADDAVSTRLLNEAIDQGYTFFDTAELYGFGHNEELIGKALSGRRQEFVLATKCGLSKQGFNGSAKGIVQSCESSLKRLNTDVIDLYYLHRVDPDVPIEESAEALGRLVAEGKVREIGLSEVCCDNLRRANSVYPVAALLDELINESTVSGARYTDARMQEADSEKD